MDQERSSISGCRMQIKVKEISQGLMGIKRKAGRATLKFNKVTSPLLLFLKGHNTN
jgi:hypothetical protein